MALKLDECRFAEAEYVLSSSAALANSYSRLKLSGYLLIISMMCKKQSGPNCLVLLLSAAVLTLCGACLLEYEPGRPLTPGRLKASAVSQTEIDLSWDPVPGAAEYTIYRSAGKGGAYGKIAAVTDGAYTDSGLREDTFYYYKISAGNSNGQSGLSGPAQCRTPSDKDIRFYAIDMDAGVFYYTWAVKKAESAHCIVYAEIGGYTGNAPEITQEQAQEIADVFDKDIYDRITGVFGFPKDVDKNGKVTLLLLDIQDGYDGNPGSPYTAGFFYPGDMEAGNSSNRKDMLYIDTWPASLTDEKQKKQSYSTVAHEFQHLINYSNRIGQGKGPMDVWIDEGLSSAAEFIYGGSLEDRIDYFSNDPRGTISRGNNFFIWNNDGWDDPLAEYATVYLFFQWLRIHASNDTEIYSAIINSAYGDYRAVETAAAAIAGGITWEAILRNWYAANFLCNSGGLWGYKDEIENKISARPISGAYGAYNNRLALAPGEGVFSSLKKAFTPPIGSDYGRNIQYSLIDYYAKSVYTDAPFNPGAGGSRFLLTINANTNKQAGKENGYVTNESYTAGGRALLAREEAYTPPELYQWDGARYFFEKLREKSGAGE